MDFFDKIRVTLSSPLKSHSSDCKDLKTWSLPAHVIKPENIRMLLYRDCDRRGKKCLFDSAHVVRETDTGKFLYIPVTNMGQVKDLSEWVFGCVPLSSNSTKRFHRWKGNLIWSKTFQAPHSCSKRSSSRSIAGDSSSCLSSTGDLTSSGYMSSSGVDDSSFDQSSTDSSRNWSLPVMKPCDSSPAIKMSHSLPSRLELPTSKMILGIAIVLATGDEDDVEVASASRDNCDRKKMRTYLSNLSSIMEASTDWFADIALKSYYNPAFFVNTLYDFAEEFQKLFISRLSCSLINIQSIPLATKALPTNLADFLTVYMTYDKQWLRSRRSIDACKVVILAGPKRTQEVKSLLGLLKLINQCSCLKSSKKEVSTNLKQPVSELTEEASNKFFSYKSIVPLGQQKSWTTNTRLPRLEQLEESPTKDEVGVDAMEISPTELCQGLESTKFMSRDSTKDSGISSMMSSTTSMKRSCSSRKFVTTLSPNDESFDELDNSPSERHGVNFHLGEESEVEQTFNMLELGEPNLDKLKQPRIVFGSLESSSSSNCKLSPAMSDAVSDNGSVDMLNFDVASVSSTVPTPIVVDLNLDDNVHSIQSVRFCSYCDNISVTDKFNPLFQIQWIKNSNYGTKTVQPGPGSGSQGLTTTSSILGNIDTGSGEIFKLSGDDWIFYNLDKNSVKYFSGSTKQEHSWSSQPSSLIASFVDHIQVLMNNSKESEIEQFVSIQLEFIRKLGEEYGDKLMELTAFDVNTMPYVGENDLSLLFAIAKWKFPELRQRFFV